MQTLSTFVRVPSPSSRARILSAFAVLLSLCVVAGAADAAKVSFEFRPPAGAQSVTVAGTFNGWDTGATPLGDEDKDGVWTGAIELAPGEYQYKFVVNGSQWISDESAASFVDDGYGGKNSVMLVADQPLTVGRATAAAPGTQAAPAAPAAPAGGTDVTFRYQPVIGGIQSVSVAGTFNGWDPAAAPLSDDDADGIWEKTLKLPPGEHQYKFVVNGTQWFPDDFAMATTDDGFGGQNSVVRVAAQPIVTGPGGNATAGAGEEPAAGIRQVTFRHRATGKPSEVALAGTFNDWTVGKTLLADPDGDGVYEATLLLGPGEYQYKFVIDGNWTTDREGADSFTDDGFGGQNSVIRVDDRFPAVEIGLGDGAVFESGVAHGQTGRELNNVGGGRVEITFPAHRGDVESVVLHVLEDGTAARTISMTMADRDEIFEYYRAEVAHEPGRAFRYAAEYVDGGTSRFLARAGFAAAAGDPSGWFAFDEASFPPFATPEWMKDAVIYQIFPDRFRNGDPNNDQTFTEWYYDGKNALPSSGKTNEEYYHFVDDWYDVAGLTQSPFRTDGRPDYFSFYGGDIAGVRQGLEYLQDLGVTAIYFNPLFEAKSNHKYDCCTYLAIDPHFGTNEEFRAFVDDAHARGIRIILDIVFNHTGNCHYAFQDAVKNGSASPYYDWYEFKRWPLPASGPYKASDYYYCWWDFGDLPDLNFDLSRANPSENGLTSIAEAQPNEDLLQHLMEVVDFWIGDMDCDGVRLDVANEVPFWFWKEFNERVKAVKPDAYIVGEIWGNASAWIGSNMFDATMNYAYFRDPVTKFLGQGQGTAAEFDRTLAAGRSAYPTQSVQVMMNLVGSHDTVRFLTQVGNDSDRMKLAAAFAFTYVGAPHIYYGDEIGMTGGKDPDCRRPFLWNYESDAQRVALRDHFRSLARIRAEHAALRRGSFTTLLAQGQVFAYERALGDDRVAVVLNAGKTAANVEVPGLGAGNAVNLLTGETVPVGGAVSIPGEGMLILDLP